MDGFSCFVSLSGKGPIKGHVDWRKKKDVCFHHTAKQRKLEKISVMVDEWDKGLSVTTQNEKKEGGEPGG